MTDEFPRWRVLQEFCIEEAFVRIEETSKGGEGCYRVYLSPSRKALDLSGEEQSFDPLGLEALVDALDAARLIVGFFEKRIGLVECLRGLRAYALTPFEELDD